MTYKPLNLLEHPSDLVFNVLRQLEKEDLIIDKCNICDFEFKYHFESGIIILDKRCDCSGVSKPMPLSVSMQEFRKFVRENEEELAKWVNREKKVYRVTKRRLK